METKKITLNDIIFKYKKFIKDKDKEWISIIEREDDRQRISEIADIDYDLYSTLLESKAYSHLIQAKLMCNRILLHEDFTVHERMAIIAENTRRNSFPLLNIFYQDTYSGWEKPVEKTVIDELNRQINEELNTGLLETENNNENKEPDFDIEIPLTPINENDLSQIKKELLSELRTLKNVNPYEIDFPVIKAQILSQMITNKEIILTYIDENNCSFITPDEYSSDHESNWHAAAIVIGKK